MEWFSSSPRLSGQSSDASSGSCWLTHPVSYPLLHTSHPFFLEELSTWESLTPCASMPLHREFSLPGCPSASCVLTPHLLKYNSNATFSSSSKVPAWHRCSSVCLYFHSGLLDCSPNTNVSFLRSGTVFFLHTSPLSLLFLFFLFYTIYFESKKEPKGPYIFLHGRKSGVWST